LTEFETKEVEEAPMAASRSPLIDSLSLQWRFFTRTDVSVVCPLGTGGAFPPLSPVFTIWVRYADPDTDVASCTTAPHGTTTTTDCTPVTVAGLGSHERAFRTSSLSDGLYDVTAKGNSGTTPAVTMPNLKVDHVHGQDPCATVKVPNQASGDSPKGGISFERIDFAGTRPVDSQGNPKPLWILGMVPATFIVGGPFSRSADTKALVPVTGVVLVKETGGDPIKPSEFHSPDPYGPERWSASFSGITEGKYKLQITVGEDPTPAPDPLEIIIAPAPQYEGRSKA
jgi:hypothetical protein